MMKFEVYQQKDEGFSMACIPYYFVIQDINGFEASIIPSKYWGSKNVVGYKPYSNKLGVYNV